MWSSRYRNELLIAAIACASLLLLLFLDPIPQDPNYHRFADTRMSWGIPNAWNVLTNIAFLAVGVAGYFTAVARAPTESRAAWCVLFAGIIAVGLGSGYYHWRPSSSSLVWDRLPMTVGFMGLFVALLVEWINPRLQRWLLIPACVLGVSSVWHWQYTDDLRLYAWVQFFPLLCLIIIPFIGANRYSHRLYLLYAFCGYMAAKLAELFDTEIFALSGELVSGHAVKHLLAAASIWGLYLMLSRRTPLAAS